MSLLNDQDKIRITFFHEEFSHGIGYPFMDKNQLQSQNLQAKFEAIVQSYRTIQMNTNNQLMAHLIIAHLPLGSGRKRFDNHSFSNQQEYAERSGNFITVENEDNYCLVRAVIIAIANHEKDPKLK